MKNKTLEYYNKHASSFIQNTVNVNFSTTQDEFLNYLDCNAYILDFGCGSGRDSKYFIDQGFQVDAIDGSMEFCKYASEFAGIKVQHMFFQELDVKKKYDGIWACSSILHLSRNELKDVIIKMQDAVKEKGIIYTSFKYGTFEGERNGRYFIDFTYELFRELLTELEIDTKLEIIKHWISEDVRPNRGEEKWLNLILQKN